MQSAILLTSAKYYFSRAGACPGQGVGPHPHENTQKATPFCVPVVILLYFYFRVKCTLVTVAHDRNPLEVGRETWQRMNLFGQR